MDLLFEANRLAGELANDLRKSMFREAEQPKSNEKRTIVAYSGHFQPFHDAHFKIYKTLVKKFGRDNVYITTTNETDEFENPLSYDDKKKLITTMFSIDEGKIQEVENPFVPKELLKKFSPKYTSFVTVVNTEDAAVLSKSKYFQHYNDAENLKPYAEVGYYLTIPEIRGEVGNQSLTSQQIMQVLGSPKTKPEVKEKLFTALYGKSDNDMLELIGDRAKSSASDIDGEFEKTKATGQVNATKPGQTDASGQDGDAGGESDDEKTPPMQRMITNPDTGREIKVQSALKYPRWKPVYKRAEKVLKSAGVDRKDRVKEPEVNSRYKARAKNMTKEELVAYLGDTLSEQLHDQFLKDGVTLTVPGLGEVTLRLNESNEPQVIVESGAAGHLLHPYEDPELTFDDMDKMVSRGLSGGLDSEAPVTEKLDGQNIMFSYRDGKILFARSNTHVRNKGAQALDVDALKSKFADRGDLGDSFGNTADDLSAAINALSEKQRAQMFKGGGKWVNLEIINPKTQNVIPYDKSILVFHNTVEYDDAGKALQLGQDEGAALARAIQKVGADKQKTFGIQGPQNIAFSDKTDREYDARKNAYIKELSAIRSSTGLGNKATLGEYFTKRWRELIDADLKKHNLSLPNDVKDSLASRWSGAGNGMNAREFKKVHPEMVAWFDGLDKNLLSLNKDVRKPIEMLFLRVGADSLVRMTNFMSANNPAVADSMKKEVLGIIKKLQDNPATASDMLQRELERLHTIGFDKVTPTEGVVFIYNGKPYKFTGTFAPVNQLSSTLKYTKQESQDTTTKDTPQPKVTSTDGKKPVVVYPGRFQPFHAGHYSVYKGLVDKYGADNVFIGTSNKTDNVKSPFDFNEKQTIMTKMFGIPADKIVQVKSPYSPQEILSKFPEDTPFITAFSEKDAERLGSGSKYFKPLPDKAGKLGNYKDAGYFTIAPEFQLDVDGENISGTTVRAVMGDPKRSPAEKKKMFTAMYGKFDPQIFDLITTKLASVSSEPAVAEPKKLAAKKVTPVATKSVVAKKDVPVGAKKSTPQAKVAKGAGSVLNKKIRNPETDRDILVKTALGYEKTHPVYKTAAKMVRSEAIIITEGGNAVEVNSKIPNQFAQPTAANVADKLGLGKLDRALVGSTHKPIMNDLDVAMDFDDVKQAIGFTGTDKKEFFAHLKTYLDKTGMEVNVQPGFQQFSIAAPLVDEKGQPQKAFDANGKPSKEEGRIQLDFMMGDLPYMKRMLTNGDTSTVSSTYRNIFLSNILGNIAEETGTPGVKKRYLINMRDGIFEETFSEKPNGKRETITKEKVSGDVEFLAKAIFGKDAQFSDIDTFDKLAKRVVQPDVKFRDKLPSIIDQFKSTITKMKKELPAGIPDTSDAADIAENGPLNVYLDDLRPMPDGFDVNPKTAEEAINLLKSGRVKFISFDHDLGPEEAGTGYDVAKWIEEQSHMNDDFVTPEWKLHSANPVGRKNIEQAMTSADRAMASRTSTGKPVAKNDVPEKPSVKMPAKSDKVSAGFDPKILNTKVKNPETDRDILVKTALKYDKTHPAYKAAEKVVRNSKK